jgi:nicotinate phosphoribosyltransferase
MESSLLFTDLYELTMAFAYLESGKKEWASFELFVRELPKNRNYLVFSGLREVIDILQNFRFSESDIDYLFSLKLFPDWFLDFLKEFHFTGNLYAMREGEIFFQNEPVLRIEAPVYEAQIFETIVMNQVHISSLIATKAARIFSVAKGKKLADFSLRRTHGYDAGLKVAKNSYLCGFDATSNVLAGKLFGIPVVGTVAHSFIMTFEREEEAFEAFLKAFPEKGILLVDTYDTLEGVKKAIQTAKKLGLNLPGVRLDSGNIVELSKETRKLLDEVGFKNAKIVVSGGLDEYKIDEILREGASVDAFGVGTHFGTSSDSPYIDFVYKLVEYDGKPVMKTSTGKKMYPGRKQVFRRWTEDTVGIHGENLEGEPLLSKLIENGRLILELPSLKESREYFLERFSKLPSEIKDICKKVEYPVKISPKLEKLYESVKEEIEEKEWENRG